MKSHFWFRDFVYCQDFFVILHPKFKEAVKIVKKETGIKLEGDDNASGRFYGYSRKGNYLAIIWITDIKDCLVHEAFHACAWVLKNREITLNSYEAEEAYAYYVSFIVKTIQDYVKDEKKEKKMRKRLTSVKKSGIIEKGTKKEVRNV